MLASNEDLARKLAALEKKYDSQLELFFEAIRELMAPPAPKKRKIGFLVKERAARYEEGKAVISTFSGIPKTWKCY